MEVDGVQRKNCSIADGLSDCAQFTAPFGASLCSSVEWAWRRSLGKQFGQPCQNVYDSLTQ